ncbi:NAD(+) diphosphatase [Amycolatopsis jiangsuensis]|uniref:NAD(+) diphosphatase n=1 Tax=Amycolatopsis jiangsuensis TaxID=1181879 RepID=A0A840IU50_9PSEU|nr:NAD(+) diphosphatase [Amycolatopsis jiangsuensis]MBB4685996.1 NAD+ diphosphatase [Amycolatopsis jiangsuensis]
MTAPFALGALPTLSRSTVDRQETLRTNPERLAVKWPEARVVLLDDTGRTPVTEGGSALATRKAVDFGAEPPLDAVFLGEWEDVDYWSMPGRIEGDADTVRMAGSWGVVEEVPRVDGEIWVDLRGYGDQLDDTSAGLFTTAQALRHWRRQSRFCTRDGSPTQLAHFGWASRCTAKGHEEYPRTDPAVICLVHDTDGVNGSHVLLARQPVWPEGRYSVLAGFVEAGESLEGCVSREIREEVGAEVSDVRYLGSQPWPFPRSIMLGFTARADRSAPLVPADGEIEEALWVSRADLRAAFRNSGTPTTEPIPTPIANGSATLLLPGNSSIARVMLQAWADAEE